MPHINLLYPFLPQNQFDVNKDKIVLDITPFTIAFEELGHFNQGNLLLILKSKWTLSFYENKKKKEQIQLSMRNRKQNHHNDFIYYKACCKECFRFAMIYLRSRVMVFNHI